MEEHLHHFAETLAALVTVLVICGRWIWRWATRLAVTHKFTTDMATNHLPHIYHVNRLIAQRMGIEVPEDPPIHFIEINGNGKH